MRSSRSATTGSRPTRRPARSSSCGRRSTATRSTGCPRAARPTSSARSRPRSRCTAPGRCRRGSAPRSSIAPRSCSASAPRSSRAPSPRRRPSRSRPHASRRSARCRRSRSPPPRHAASPARWCRWTRRTSARASSGSPSVVPIGVVGAISPFNFPLNLVAHKVAPAIAAGCPVVLKPASQTPLSAIALAELLLDECGLPAGHLNVVTGSGGNVGDPLVDHHDVAVITFTGSPEVGWSIRGRAPRKKVGLELGQQRAGHPRARRRRDGRGHQDLGGRVQPRRAVVHLDATGVRARGHRRRVPRGARPARRGARGRRSARRGDRRVVAHLDRRPRPGRVVDRRSGRGRGEGRTGGIVRDGVLAPTVLTTSRPT